MDFEITAMDETDATEAIALEQRATRHSWTLRAVRDCLQSGCQASKISTDSTIRGYCLSRASGHEIEILNLVVDPGYQHRGLARHLIGDLIERGLNSETDVVFLEVRRSNTRARRLYTAMGFEQVGTRRGYYVGTPEGEDALVMRCNLGRAGNYGDSYLN